MFILCFGSNRNAFYLYMVTSAACSSMGGYIRGVATVRIELYPAIWHNLKDWKKRVIYLSMTPRAFTG